MRTPVFNIAPGKIISYRGEPCIVLEHRKDGTLLMVTEQIEHEFGSDNNFAFSSLRAHLNDPYLRRLTDGNPDEVVARTVDLAALNGSKEYGTVECKVAPPTLDELRKYHDIIPTPECFEWSVTPRSTPWVNEDNKWVMGLDFSGHIAYGSCTGIRGVRPAFLINSTFEVEDPDSTSDNPLERFTTQELAEEIFRRFQKEEENR